MKITQAVSLWIRNHPLPEDLKDYWKFNEWLYPVIPEINTERNQILIRVQFLLKSHRHAPTFTKWSEEFLNLLDSVDESAGPTEREVYWSPLLEAIWLLFKPAQEAFDIRKKIGRLQMLDWYLTTGVRLFVASPRFLNHWDESGKARNSLGHLLTNAGLPKELSKYQLQQDNSAATTHLGPSLHSTISLIGFTKFVTGISEDLRTLNEHLNLLGIAPDLIDVEDPNILIASDRRRKIEVFCMPASQLMNLYFRIGLSINNSRYRIGYIPWELERWPNDLKRPFEFLHEVWCSTEFIADSVRPFFNGTIRIVPLKFSRLHGANSNETQGERPFTFLYSFDPWSYSARKNPIAGINAFKRAFSSNRRDVKLLIKVPEGRLAAHSKQHLVHTIGSDSRIEILERSFSREEFLKFFSSIDCYVSLHRSEGFGRQIMEAMMAGKPVIVTDYSGNKDFCDTENSYLVPYRRIPVDLNDYPFSRNQFWADAISDIAASQMKLVVKNPDLRQRRTTTAIANSISYFVGEKCHRGEDSAEILRNLIANLHL